MAESASGRAATLETGKRKQSAQEISTLKVAAGMLFVHDPGVENLNDLAAHPSLKDGLSLLPEGTLQRWALEDDWHGKVNRTAQHMRHHLQTLVGNAHLERQRKHIEQMSNIYNLTGKHLASLRPKSFEQMMQARIRALELVHAWESDLQRANHEALPGCRVEDDEAAKEPTILDKMSDSQVRNIFNAVLRADGE